MTLEGAIEYHFSIGNGWTERGKDNLQLAEWLRELMELRQENKELVEKLNSIEAKNKEDEELTIPENLAKHEDLLDERGQVIIDGEMLDKIAKDRLLGKLSRYHVSLEVDGLNTTVMDIDAHSKEEAILAWAEAFRYKDYRLSISSKTYCNYSINVWEGSSVSPEQKGSDAFKAITQGQVFRYHQKNLYEYIITLRDDESNVHYKYPARGVTADEALYFWANQYRDSRVFKADIKNMKCVIEEPRFTPERLENGVLLTPLKGIRRTYSIEIR